MKKKNKKISVKKILIIIILLTVIFGVLGIAIYSKNKNDRNGVFSIIEKRWIEKNKSTVIDVSILNDLPLFGDEGDGVFFDFLNDFTKETNLNFNMIPYSKAKSSDDSGYTFEINDNSALKDNELSFYTDNYVMISKDSERVKKFSDLTNSVIGVLDTDLSMIKEYLNDNSGVVYNTYNDIDTIVKALNDNDIKYAIVPKNIYIKQILKNNYYIVYNISDIYTNYVLKVNGKEKVLNSIIKKYYIRWKRNGFDKSYNERLFDLYMEQKGLDEIAKADFTSKDYIYGYVRNIPYETEINNEFIGYNSEILDDFASSMKVSFKVKEYTSIDDLAKAINDGKVDLAFNYYDFKNITNKVDYTTSTYNEKLVVLTSINNINTTMNSFVSLRDKNVSMLDNKIASYIEDNTNANVKKFKKASTLFNSLNDDSIVILDYNTYNYYKNNELESFKVIYEEDINDDFNFILVNSNKNKTFNSIFKYYVSTLNTDLYKSRALLKFSNDSKKIDLSYVYFIIGIVVLTVFSILYFKNRTISSRVKKEDKMKYVDHLTSLKNRHYLNQNYLKWQANKIYPQAIIVVNVNKVGHINDVYGHEEGDMVIKQAANVLINNQLEQSDIVRTNGDEFLIYLVGYEETKVITYMRRLYKEFKNLPYKFGASLGYSMILDDVKTIDDAINEAVLEIKTNKESQDEK
ncbi:MAG: diguanylate cyclase [Bacilli bacterium]|nr:diguanylate cyclase [Bacilli bacterium]MBO6195763.1 diguanylate cyclase [Bacilli bacterium]